MYRVGIGSVSYIGGNSLDLGGITVSSIGGGGLRFDVRYVGPSDYIAIEYGKPESDFVICSGRRCFPVMFDWLLFSRRVPLNICRMIFVCFAVDVRYGVSYKLFVGLPSQRLVQRFGNDACGLVHLIAIGSDIS